MDEFREWLSDNLRYFMLGFAIIIILVLLFFGIRLLSSIFDGKEDASDDQQIVQEQMDEQQQDDSSSENQPVEGENTEETDTEESTALEKNAYPKINALMQNYYTALSNRNVQDIKTMVDALDPADESAIENSHYIESYSNVEVYTKPGLTENSYVVFICYGHKYVGYETVLPGMSCMYVETREDDTLYIVSEPTEEQENYMTQVLNDEDTQKLLNDTQTAYDEALAKDTALSTYLSELGVKGSAAMTAEEGTTIVVDSNCNVRKEASADSEKIGELVAGQEVTKLGQDGDWIIIDFEGQSGYVRGDLFK